MVEPPSKEWCAEMARREGDLEVGAGPRAPADDQSRLASDEAARQAVRRGVASYLETYCVNRPLIKTRRAEAVHVSRCGACQGPALVYRVADASQEALGHHAWAVRCEAQPTDECLPVVYGVHREDAIKMWNASGWSAHNKTHG